MSKGRNITWKLKDKTGVYDPRPSINNDGKSQGEVIPPIVHEGPNSVTHGPFNEVTPDGEWWKYNIVLTKMGGGGQEVIDPDYRVDP